MRRVIALELVGLKKLDCDLYDETGKIIYVKGTDFTPELLMKLSHAKIYKRDEQEYVEEQKKTWPPVKKFKEPKEIEPPNPPEKAEFQSVVNSEKTQHLVGNIKEVLNAIMEGVPPKASLCLEATHSICEEVYQKLDKVGNINQLRIQDFYTYAHSINTAVISTIIGREIGIPEDKVRELSLAAYLHDIGKTRLPQEILYKKGKLTTEEFELIKSHAQLGYDFIKNEMRLPEHIARGALEHHERWHGDGYPNKLKGKEISKFAQIIGIADVFDALVSEKIYRSSVHSNDAIRIMLTEEAKSFNPEIFHKFAFLTVVKNISPVP